MAIENLEPTTELQAINTMLAAIGEAPLAALDSGHPDEAIASQILTEAVRETQARRWRFNSEYNFAIVSAGTEGGRNVFEVPADLASWKLAQVEAQRGIDIVAREERAAVPLDGSWIFADRLNGTDGIADLDELVINPVWFVDFIKCPQSFRTWVTILAAIRFQAQAVGGNEDSSFGFTEKDEQRAFALFLEDQQEHIPVPPLSSTASTELEALNQVLVANGAPPVVSLQGLHNSDQFLALQMLRDVSREVQAEGWRWNYESGFELAASDTYDWVDSDDVTTTLNIFEPPTDMLAYGVTPSTGQVGGTAVDVSVRLSTRYNDPNFVAVFYDRERNRDGLKQADHEFLYLDLVSFVSWDQLPETARQYFVVLASRRFQATRPDPRTLPWTDKDERMALRALTRDQGNKRRRNVLDHPDTWDFRGRRTPQAFSLTRAVTRR